MPFELPPEGDAARSKRFKPGTKFEAICDLYIFDRRLRLLVLEAIEKIEIHVRSRWTYRMAHDHGSHAHLEHSLFTSGLKHAEQLVRLARAVDKPEETFILHYKRKYTQPYSPPLWAATELMTLGELSKWFQATRDNALKSAIGHDLGLPTREIVEGVLQVLAYVRNICAHHGRLWNRRLVKRLPRIKRFQSDMVLVPAGSQTQNDNRLYNVLVVLLYLLDKQATDSSFRGRLIDLLASMPDEVYEAMGCPEDWAERSVWRK